MRILVGGVISRHPFVPGSVWNRMHWTVGLQRLGHEVFYVEDIRPRWCVDEEGCCCPFERCVNREHFVRTMHRFGLSGVSCQIFNGGEATCGLSLSELLKIARSADLLINHSGHLKVPEVLNAIQRRAYVDQDPVYTQLSRSEYGKDANLASHDVFFTIGQNIGTTHSPIPDAGIRWHHVLPPVVLDFWPVASDRSSRFTTVASRWASGELMYDGTWLKPKYAELDRFADLPRRTDQQFEIALRDYCADVTGLQKLRAGGWHLTDSRAIGDLDGYRDFLARSRAEVGIAKSAYVGGRSGWFSDRTVQYLACGKPVAAQATGFERVVSTGRGLLTFSTPDDAVEAVARINRDYASHCDAARRLAEDVFDYRRVLPAMLMTAMAA